MKIPIKDFYYEYKRHFNRLVLALYEVMDDGSIKVGIKLEVEPSLIDDLQRDFVLIKNLQLNHIDVSGNYIQLLGGEDSENLRSVDTTFLQQIVSIGGSLYNLAAYDVDAETKCLYDAKYSYDLQGDNYGDCMGAAFNEAINGLYNLHNVFEWDADKLISEMQKSLDALRKMIIESGEELEDECDTEKKPTETIKQNNTDNDCNIFSDNAIVSDEGCHENDSAEVTDKSDYTAARNIKELYKRIEHFYNLVVSGIYEYPENQELVSYEHGIDQEDFEHFRRDYKSFERVFGFLLQKYENSVLENDSQSDLGLYNLLCEIDFDYMSTLISPGGSFYNYMTFDMYEDRDNIFNYQLNDEKNDSGIDEKMSKAHTESMEHQVKIRDQFDNDERKFMELLKKSVRILEIATNWEKR